MARASVLLVIAHVDVLIALLLLVHDDAFVSFSFNFNLITLRKGSQLFARFELHGLELGQSERLGLRLGFFGFLVDGFALDALLRGLNIVTFGCIANRTPVMGPSSTLLGSCLVLAVSISRLTGFLLPLSLVSTILVTALATATSGRGISPGSTCSDTPFLRSIVFWLARITIRVTRGLLLSPGEVTFFVEGTDGPSSSESKAAKILFTDMLAGVRDKTKVRELPTESPLLVPRKKEGQ